jgi:hypothetical protein
LKVPVISETKPIEDSISKVNDEFAVGSDLDFQVRWERFERLAWIILTIFIILSLAGVFGRGPVAKRHLRASDGSMEIQYERVQRFGTPSVLEINFPASSIHDGSVQLWAADSLLKPLGAQRVIPAPLRSEIGGGGILYTFPATTVPAAIEFQTQPAALGSSELKLRVPGKAELKAKVFVMP